MPNGLARTELLRLFSHIAEEGRFCWIKPLASTKKRDILNEQSKMRRKTMLQEYGQYIVADPKICHGKLTFRGTRVFVSSVLEYVAEGMDWDEISRRWNGIPHEAIADAVRYASQAFVEKSKALQIPEDLAA
jgi:uncharacterized protein (DUF433 family)